MTYFRKQNKKNKLKYFTKISLVLLFNLLAVNLLAQPLAKKNRIDGIVAVVGDKIITLSEVESELANLKQQAEDKDQVPANARCLILDNLVINKLMLNQAELDSIEVSEEEVEAQLDRRIRYFVSMIGSVEKLQEYYGKSLPEIKEEFKTPIREQILIQRMQESISGSTKISPVEVRNFFKKIPSDSIPYFETELEIGQLVVLPPSSDDGKDYAIQKLEDLKKRVAKGEKFSTLAILYSEDPGSAPDGGDLGFFGRGDMVPEFEAQAFRLKPGETSPVFKTPYGYHILTLEERIGERVKARHILIKPPLTNSELSKARKLADSLRTLLVEEKITFLEAVKRYSKDDASKNNGGMLQNPQTGNNRFSVDQLEPAVFFQIDKLKEGEFSEPVAYVSPNGNRGFRIYYLQTRTKPHKASLETDYDKIQTAALNAKKAETLNTWLENAKARNFIKIEEAFLSCEVLERWKKQ